MHRRITALAVLAALGGVSLAPALAAAQASLPPLIPREREIAMALGAAPKPIAERAAVLVLERGGGYVEARAGSNGFNCLVERTTPEAIEPICYGPAAEAVVARVLKEAKLREEGRTPEEVARVIAEDYRRGALRAPAPGAVAYMLAAEQTTPDPATGRAVTTPPHVMFYQPYATNADLGHPAGGPAPEASGLPFVVGEGEPTAFVVILQQR